MYDEGKHTSRLLPRACMELVLRKSVARFAGHSGGMGKWGRLLYLHSGNDTDVSFASEVTMGLLSVVVQGMVKAHR